MLDTRLQKVAALVRPGSRLADVGTDHAHLPTALVRQGICPQAIASDVRTGPVQAARRTVEAAGLAGSIDVRLGDGLEPIRPEEVDDIVIAGMGGETIAAILAAAPWVMDSRYRLILQPMTRGEELRRYLFGAGFGILQEQTAEDSRHIYAILSVQYTGQAFQPEEALCFVGRMPPKEGEPYLRKAEERLFKQIEGLRQSDMGRGQPHGEEIKALLNLIKRIEEYIDGSWQPWK